MRHQSIKFKIPALPSLKSIRKDFLQNTEKITLGMTLMAMFFNIGFWIENNNSWHHGLFDPFVTSRIQLFDLFFLITILIYFWKNKFFLSLHISLRQKKLATISLVLIILVMIATISGLNPNHSTLFLLRILECIGIFALFKNKILSLQQVIIILIASALAQALIATGQFLMQGSLGFSWLGESNIAPNIPGVAKFGLEGREILRGYGTFPHANILGGVLGSIFVLLLSEITKVKNKKIWLGIIGLGIFISFSRTAILGVILGGGFLFLTSLKSNKKILSFISILLVGILILLRPGSTAISERLIGYNLATEIIQQNPLGIGPGNFTLALNEKPELATWEYQPVHSVPLVLATELGLIATLLLFYLLMIFIAKRIKWAQKRTTALILVLTPPFIFDHYFWDIPQGLILLTVFLWIMSEFPRERQRRPIVTSKKIKRRARKKSK